MTLDDVLKMLLAARFSRADRREALWTSFSFLVEGTHDLPPVSLGLYSTCLPVPYVSWLKELRGNVEDKAILLLSTADFQGGREWTGAEESWPLAFYTGLYFSLKFLNKQFFRRTLSLPSD